MADWTWSVDSGADGRELTAASSRTLTVRRRAPSDATFTLPGFHDEAEAIDELVSDLTVRRAGQKLFRGRVGPTGDDIGEDEYKVTVNAVDYRGVLQRRLILDTDPLGPFVAVDAGELAFNNIVGPAQARTNGDLGITAGDGIPAGVNAPTTTLTAGKSVAAHLDLLSSAGVFDWDVDADLRLNVWPSGHATATGEVLDWGGVLSKVRRTVDPSTFANAARFTGDDSLPAALVAAADIASRPEGRWEAQFGDRDIHDAAVLAAKADAELRRAVLVLPGYSVTFAPGAWRGPRHVWPGHVVKLVVNAGRLRVETTIIVEELRVSVGESGDETVEAALGWAFPSDAYKRRLPAAESRVRDLERV